VTIVTLNVQVVANRSRSLEINYSSLLKTSVKLFIDFWKFLGDHATCLEKKVVHIYKIVGKKTGLEEMVKSIFLLL